MEREQAAEEFARMLYKAGVVRAYEVFFECMATPLGHQKAKWQGIQDWYVSKGPEEQHFINLILKEVLIESVFGVAVNFDGDAGFEEVDNKFAEFVVSLRVYGSIEDEDEGPETDFVEICPTNGGENIHDIFMSFIDEASGEH